MPQAETIKIRRDGRRLFIEPFPEFLKQELVFLVKDTAFGKGRNAGKIKVQQVKEIMYVEDELSPGRFIVPAGFLYKIWTKLNAMGWERSDIDYKDLRELDLEEPQLDNLDPLRGWQAEALPQLLSSEGGVIHTSTATGKSFLIKQFCKLYPNTTIIVTGHVGKTLEDIYRYLVKEYGTDQVKGLASIGGDGDPGRITVCHIRSLLSAPIDKAKILIYDEVHGAASTQRVEFLSRVQAANMYGFTASLCRLDDKDPFVEALFGPILYEKPYKEALAEGLVSRIDVHVYPVEGYLKDYKSYYRRQLYGIVRNNTRNKIVAQAARKYDSDGSTVVFAFNNLEHVFRLKKLLPDYTPVYSPQSMTGKRYNQLLNDGLIPKDYKSLHPGEDFIIADKFFKGEIRKVIATSVWSEGVNLPELNTIVRAEGLPGNVQAVQLPGRVARKTETKNSGVVVDFNDVFHPTFLNRSKRRFKHYEDLGYSIIRKELDA
jgi:superfamily II DNA or RNA helicase